MKRFFILILFIIPALLAVQGQEADSTSKSDPVKADSAVKKDCKQGAIGDLFRKKDKAPKPPKKMLALVLPNISSNPTNGFLLGVGGSFGWYMGPKENTKVSSAPFTVAVTSKSQLITFVKHNIYTKENKFFLQGDWKYYIYSQPTYGLGTNAPDTIGLPSSISWLGEGTPTDSVIFPMKYNFFKFTEIVNKQIIGEFYGGIGYHLDYYYSIDDQDYRAAVPATDSTPAIPEQLTPHSYYSDTNSFSKSSYTVSGLSVNFLYDTHDNQINPYKCRTTLPYLGDDQRARAGRGYTNGRYRGEHMVYGEVEYRFPIWPCSNIIGGVVFVNAVTTSNTARNISLFEYVRPAVGFGIRVMVNKYFRTNINLDYAIGMKSKGFYFSGQETF